jgi:hypothetical protein
MKHRLSSAPPAGLDTWGLDPIDYRLNQDLTLIRRYPSPLTHFGLGSRAQKQKKVMKRKTQNLSDKMIFRFISHILSYLVYPISLLRRLAVTLLVVLSHFLLVKQQRLMFLIRNMHI